MFDYIIGCSFNAPIGQKMPFTEYHYASHMGNEGCNSYFLRYFPFIRFTFPLSAFLFLPVETSLEIFLQMEKG